MFSFEGVEGRESDCFPSLYLKWSTLNYCIAYLQINCLMWPLSFCFLSLDSFPLLVPGGISLLEQVLEAGPAAGTALTLAYEEMLSSGSKP